MSNNCIVSYLLLQMLFQLTFHPQYDYILYELGIHGHYLYLSSRNVMGIDVRDVNGVDPVSLLSHDKVLVTVGALKALEESLS